MTADRSTRHDTARFGCNTYSYIRSHSAADCVGRLADFGFTNFEVMVYPGHLWPRADGAATVRDLRQVIAARGLRLVTLNMPNIDINVAAAVAEMRRYSLDLVKDIVTLAGALGAPGVVIGPGKANPLSSAPAEELTGHFFRALDELVPVAERAGTALWVENMPFAYLPAIGDLMTTLDRYGNDGIGIVYDVANAYFIGEDLSGGLARCRDRLKLVHFSDTHRQVYRHDPVGAGSVPFETVPAALAAVGYRELPMLEIISADPDRDIVDSATRLAALGLAGKTP